jgi:hypothetical protein
LLLPRPSRLRALVAEAAPQEHGEKYLPELIRHNEKAKDVENLAAVLGKIQRMAESQESPSPASAKKRPKKQ